MRKRILTSGILAAAMAVSPMYMYAADTSADVLTDKYIIIELGQSVGDGMDVTAGQVSSSVDVGKAGSEGQAIEAASEGITSEESVQEAIASSEDSPEETSMEEVSVEADAVGTEDALAAGDAVTYDELLCLGVDMDYAQYSVTCVEADEPIIAVLLSQSEDYAGYDRVALYEIGYTGCFDAGSDGNVSGTDVSMTHLFRLRTDGESDVSLYALDGEGNLVETVLEPQYIVVEKTATTECAYETSANHWLIVYLEASDAMVSDAGASNAAGSAQTAQKSEDGGDGDEEAAESLEGMTDDEGQETEASGNQTDIASGKTSGASDAGTDSGNGNTTAASTAAPATVAPTTAAPAMAAPTTAAPATAAPTTAAPTTAAPTTVAPTTTAHSHTWTAVTSTVHHDAVWQPVWVEDMAAYDETVVVQEAYDEQVLVSEAYDEPVYIWVDVCNRCGHQFWSGDDDINVHMGAGCWSSWHGELMPNGEYIHHDAIYETVHHDAVTQTVHHDATGHYEQVLVQAEYDETVTTGYVCTECGATK